MQYLVLVCGTTLLLMM